MDEQFLRYYSDELQYLRELGAEFAAAHPKIAGRLGMRDISVSDPFVERLLEGFAFLTARVRLRQDAEFPKFTNNLLDAVYPNFLSPMPSMTIVQFTPDPSEDALAEGYLIPRHSQMLALLGRGEQTRTSFRTAHDVELWPLKISEARYLNSPANVSSYGYAANDNVKAAIAISLQTTGGQLISDLPLDQLTVHLKGSERVPGALYEQLHGRALGIAVRGANGFVRLDNASIEQVGFNDEESLLPDDGRGFGGIRLLQEFFAFPDRFMFARLAGLQDAVARCESSSMELLILLSESHESLVDVLSADHLGLFCSPAINLFERRADRVRITPQSVSHHVLADRTRPMDFEIWGVVSAKGIAQSADESFDIHPLYASAPHDGSVADFYYIVSREGRLLSSRQRRQGTRSSGYVGSETYISLASSDGQPIYDRVEQVELVALCTNRDLPMQGAWGQGTTDFDLQIGAPLLHTRCVDLPTSPKATFADGESNWRLINLLSANYLSITDGGAGAETLRELLRVFAQQSELTSMQQLDGIIGVESEGIAARLPVPGPQSFGRGVQISLTLDEAAFDNAGAFLFGAVLERFFGRHVTINSFTRTRVLSRQRNEIMKWPIRAGQRTVL